jgi:hypothetical protein
MRRWRKMTWVFLVVNGLFLVWVIGAIADRPSKNCPPGDELCVNASDAGTSIGVGLVIFLWFVVFVVLALVWLMTRPRRRLCPVCGEDVRKGATVCKNCGHDFAAAARPVDAAAETQDVRNWT